MSIHYKDDTLTLHHGDALMVLRDLPDGSVDCIVTSPPYFGLRDYGVDGQLGAEPSPAEFVQALVAVFREARRVLADDGTLWLNLGDSYASKSKGTGGDGSRSTLTRHTPEGRKRSVERQAFNSRKLDPDVPAKNLLGIPWRVAFALQDDGWTLRNDVIWSKPNAMPESVADRLSNRHEHLFMLTKSRRYWFDLNAIREPHTTPDGMGWAANGRGVKVRSDRDGHNVTSKAGLHAMGGDPLGKNPGDVWSIPTQPYPGAHFAVFPPALAERCILAGCKPGGTVLDPFSGSGTTGMVAAKHGRRYVGIDLNAEYLDLSLRTRLQQPGLDFEGGAA